MALPSSILANAQSLDLKTRLTGTIGRACAVMCVDEIVIFSDGAGVKAAAENETLLLHILSYLETPQYLRKHLFPMHPNLRFAGLLPPLDIPSHLRTDELCLYREAVSEGPAPGDKGGSILDAGLQRRVWVAEDIPEHARVTLRFASAEEGGGATPPGELWSRANPVSPDAPRLESGYYWGYVLRTCANLSSVFTEAPWEGGYDVTVGTSERGEDIAGLHLPKAQHLLVVFGGVAGLERALQADEELKKAGVKRVEDVFDFWVDVMLGQGSRTIRTEEALWIALSRLKEKR